MYLVRTLILAAALTATLSAASAADPMTGADVKTFFAAGKFKAAAGSVFGFNADGTFEIDHSNGSESGTWSVAADGTVTRQRDGASKPDVFYIDVNAKGKRTIIYTAGKYKGKKFPLR
jgi:phosphate-selective porin